MALYPQLQQFGVANGTAIMVDVSRIEFAYEVTVQLTAAYATSSPAGGPGRPSLVGRDVGDTDYPRTIPAGTVLTLIPAEAAALISAGAAVVYGSTPKTADSTATADSVVTADV